MISLKDLEADFYPVEPLGDGLVRCADELRDRTVYSYFRLDSAMGPTPFIVSDDLVDDDFARLVLGSWDGGRRESLQRVPLRANPYGFSYCVWAPPSFHAQLRGRRLDRGETIWGIPIHARELSGQETAQDLAGILFRTLRADHWPRSPQPKLSLRFDNPRTRSGTGDGYVFADVEVVSREIGNLLGAPGGFVEVIDVDGAVVEISCEVAKGGWLRPPREFLRWIEGRRDEVGVEVTQEEAAGRLAKFAAGTS